MRALVTGAAGLIGRILCALCWHRGWQRACDCCAIPVVATHWPDCRSSLSWRMCCIPAVI